MVDEPPFDTYIPSPAQAQQAEALILLLKQCHERRITVGVFGGYGLDALYGKLTRDHGDFDLVVEIEAQHHLDAVLAMQGYRHMPEWSEPGRKDVYIHPAMAAPFKVEVASFAETALATIGQRYGLAIDRCLFFPETSNGQLLGYPMRVPTFEGIEIINRIQAYSAAERGWAEFAHRNHQTALLALLKREQASR